jgi:CheY-like chemotaxis protein
VVDVHKTNRRILTEMLNRFGMRATPAEDARTAIEELESAKARGQAFGVVVVDVHLPDEDGFAFTTSLREREDLAETPVIFVSSAKTSEEARRGRALGVESYLVKPVKPSSLLDALVSAVGVRFRAAERDLVAHRGREPRRPLRILLVEDNEMNQKVATHTLQKWRHHVTVAGNGLEAIGQLQSAAFDLILMDIQMPGMDGFQTTAAIRESESGSGRHTPIIAMTARAMQKDRDECLAAGMEGYVSKPINTAQLFDAIESVTHGAADRRAAAAEEDEPASRAEAAPAEVLDKTALLRRVDGDREFLGEMLSTFLSGHVPLVAEIRAGIAAGDAARVQRSAHTLKSMVGNFYAHAAFQVAHALESAAREGRLSDAPAASARLDQEIQRLTAALKELES